MPEEVVFDHLHATAFQWTPLGRTILGSADNVRRITRQNLLDYISTHYTANRMVLAAAGAVDHDELVKLAEAKFGAVPTGTTSTSDLVKQAPAFFTGSEVRFRDPDLPLVQFAVAFEGASWTDPDAIPLMVLQTMIGAWDKQAGAGLLEEDVVIFIIIPAGENMASPLAQLVAINELCHSYMAFNTNYKDTGLFGVYAVADKGEKLQDLMWSILTGMTKMCYKVTEDDVVRARNQLKAQLLYAQDATTTVAEDIGRQLLVYGRRIPKAELFARIDAVDADTIQQVIALIVVDCRCIIGHDTLQLHRVVGHHTLQQQVADRFVYDQDLAMAAMGDTQFLPDYNFMRRRTFWLRY